jgi:lysozyme
MVNDATLNLITLFEGFVPNWYPDPAHGWKVPTCCYGHTDAAGEPKYAATKAKRFTKTEGRAILAKDLGSVEATVKRLVKVPLDANQLGALVSFTFNLGEGNLTRSSLLKKLNAKDYHGAANEFGKWVRAGGKVLKGLVRRRAAEAALFTTPV